MKRIIYILAVMLSVTACTNQEILIYDVRRDGIQFDDKDGTFRTDYNFAFQYEMVEQSDEWSSWEVQSYYGDALREDKVRLVVSIMGWASDVDRKFRLKAAEGEGLSPELVRFEDEYIFHANRLVDTVEVTLLRLAARGTYKTVVTFDLEGSHEDFAAGAEEKLKYTFNISDRYPKPYEWDGREPWLGEYSEEKYAFMVTVLNKVYNYWMEWDVYNQELRDALDEYNAAHPDNPKDFTFPVNTSNPWW